MRRLLLIVTIALFSTGLHAAGSGDRCKAPTISPQYLCEPGTFCRQSIRNMYCVDDEAKNCGWNGKTGYYVGKDKTYRNKKYKCKFNGFKLAYGERCKPNPTEPKYTCATNANCLTAISVRYCARSNKECGWRNTDGFDLGEKKQWKGKEYECYSNGFQEVVDTTSTNPLIYGEGIITHKITHDMDLRALVSAADAKLGFSSEPTGPGSLCFIRWDNNTYYGPPRPFTEPRGVQFCANNMLPPGPPLLDMSTLLSCRFRAFAGIGQNKLADGWKLVAAQVQLPSGTSGVSLQYNSRPNKKGNQSLEVDINMIFGCLQLESVTLKGPSMQWRDAFE